MAKFPFFGKNIAFFGKKWRFLAKIAIFWQKCLFFEKNARHQKWLRTKNFWPIFKNSQNIKTRRNLTEVFFFVAILRSLARRTRLLDFKNVLKSGHFGTFFQRSTSTEKSGSPMKILWTYAEGNRGWGTRFMHLKVD